MDRCEDYPCCGHTDGLPCNWKAPDFYPHAGCDHEAGYCQVWEEENDDDDDDLAEQIEQTEVDRELAFGDDDA